MFIFIKFFLQIIIVYKFLSNNVTKEKQMNFLVVDDSPTVRRLVVSCLRGMGFTEVVEADDGMSALEILRQKRVDLILTDWVMPYLSGVELANLVRADDKLKHIPIMMITTKGNKDDVLKAASLKINGYIVKPFTPETFRKKLEPVLRSIKSRRNIVKKENKCHIKMLYDNKHNSDINLIETSFMFKTEHGEETFISSLKVPSHIDGKIIISTELIIDKASLSVHSALLDEERNVLDSNDTDIFDERDLSQQL